MVLTGDNFKSFITQDEIVIVDFYAVWCGPCRMLSPVLEELENDGTIKVGKVDVDSEEATAIAYGVQNIPTLLAFKNGKLLGRKVGFLPKNAILDWISTIK